MSLADPQAWVFTNSFGYRDEFFYTIAEHQFFTNPLDSEDLWNPTGGDGQGAFVAPVRSDRWLSWAGGFSRLSFEWTGDVIAGAGNWSNGIDSSGENFPQYGDASATFDNSSPHTGTIEATLGGGAIAAGLWLGPLLPGSFSLSDDDSLEDTNGYRVVLDDGDGNLLPSLGAISVTGSGIIDYNDGSLSFSFTGTWRDNPYSIAAGNGGVYLRPRFYGSGPSMGEAIPTPDALPSLVTLHWRRLNEPAEAPITFRLIAVDALRTDYPGAWPPELAANDLDEVELPDSFAAESGSYEFAIPSGTRILAVQLWGEVGCVPESGIEFWFTQVAPPPTAGGPILSAGIASTIQELLQD